MEKSDAAKKLDVPTVIVEKPVSSNLNISASSRQVQDAAAGATASTALQPSDSLRAPNIKRHSYRESVMSAVRLIKKSSKVSYDIDKFTIVVFQDEYSNISPIYLFYKYCHALVMLAFLAVNLYHLIDEKELKWHLYVNHWSSIICSSEAICGVFVVSYYHHQCRTKAMRDTMRLTDSMITRLMIYTYLNATAMTFSTTASLLFWAFIYEDEFYTFGRIIEHAAIPAFMVAKLLVENIPFDFTFGVYPLAVLLCYFIDVITYYFLLFRDSFLKGKIKIYIFKYFDDISLIFFIWFTIEASLILAGVHVILVLINISKNLIFEQCCHKRSTRIQQPISRAPEAVPTKVTMLIVLKDAEHKKKKLSTTWLLRTYQAVKKLEQLNRHDFIQSEWLHRSFDRPSGFYLAYRFIHMQLFVVMVFFSIAEPDNTYSRTAKYFMLWIFYFANFFMCLSLFQSIFGFAIIFKAYRLNIDDLKYFEKSERYVTGVQKVYSAMNSVATTLAVFILATSWQLLEDTGGSFHALDYRYDSSHIINPLAMFLDFIVVGHPFKMVYFCLSACFFIMNVVFNYWLYSSRITSRTGQQFIYEYLNWDDTGRTFANIGILLVMLVMVHCALWVIFLLKRSFSIEVKKRRYGEQQKYHMLRELSLASVPVLTVPSSQVQQTSVNPSNLLNNPKDINTIPPSNRPLGSVMSFKSANKEQPTPASLGINDSPASSSTNLSVDSKKDAKTAGQVQSSPTTTMNSQASAPTTTKEALSSGSAASNVQADNKEET